MLHHVFVIVFRFWNSKPEFLLRRCKITTDGNKDQRQEDEQYEYQSEKQFRFHRYDGLEKTEVDLKKDKAILITMHEFAYIR